ncbi:MAG TPA: L-histidine N(alpha)-methyltransferase [Burkholderiales bacterium]|nr:L-histidine N(alpha)-methyltransferase [Burkholderiales bacterium]
MVRARAAYSLHDLHPDTGDFLDDVWAGLSQPRKTLPPKYFYDPQGCLLFEAICALPEYYLTRAETALMNRHVGDMAGRLGPASAVIEYGSGSGRKTRILLAASRPAVYVPIDIARAQLDATAAEIAREFPGLQVVAVCADYMRPFSLPDLEGLGARRRVVYFPGSTIGNLTPEEAAVFLTTARAQVQRGGGMLIGVDLKKDADRLNAAYNDSRGVTAAFNLNLLARINRELGADFDPAAFRHRAVYDAALGRIEMHLECLKAQSVTIGGRTFHLRKGETIHTENSYKYSIGEFQELARGAGLSPVTCWTDPDQLFGVHYLTVPD